ncbi:hypothetical protein GMD55_18415 [Ruthenibacterium lactatiformans]|nr:hypothetical protein [Ruthenibacterium lactatiformans]
MSLRAMWISFRHRNSSGRSRCFRPGGPRRAGGRQPYPPGLLRAREKRCRGGCSPGVSGCHTGGLVRICCGEVRKMILVQTIGVFAALMSVIGVVLAASKAKRPLLRALGSAVCGAASLGAVNLLAGYTGVSIALNYATAFVAVVLGAPGVVTMLLLRVLLLF